MASHGIPRHSVEVVENIEQTQKEIQAYRDLETAVHEKITAHEYTHETLNQVSELLKKNPEYYTIWNYRRLIRQHDFLEATSEPSDQPEADQIVPIIQSDLDFLFPLLRSFPKCYWIWNYRLWILNEAKRLLPQRTAREFWQRELALVGKMLHADSRNFHGWGYRAFVIEALEELAGDGDEKSMAQTEIDYTTKMIGANLSNFSAWHYRTKLIQKHLNEKQATDQARRQVLEQELELAHKALIDPYDQSLWFYHQNLMCVFDPSLAERTMAPNLSSSERLEYVEEQKELINEMLEDYTDCKWIYQALVDCNLLIAKIEGAMSAKDRTEVADWLKSLIRLDPLRKGHWVDIEKSVNGDGLG